MPVHPALVAKAGLSAAWLERLEIESKRTMRNRVLLGIPAYTGVAAGFWLGSDLGHAYPRFSVTMTLVHLIAGVLRTLVMIRPPHARHTKTTRARWELANSASALLCAGLFGLHLAVAVLLLGLCLTTMIMMMATTAMVLAVAHGLSPRAMLMRTSTTLLLGPVLVATLMTHDPARYGVAALIGFFLLYASLLGHRLGVEYWQGAVAVAQLAMGRDEVLRSKQDLLDLIRTTPDAMGVLSAESTILFVNPAWTSLLQYEAADLIGKKLVQLAHPDDVEGVRLFLEASSVGNASSAEFCFMRRDQTPVTWELGPGQTLVYEGRPARSVVARDVTERNRMRSQLIISERLASIGTLAAGVAHEINNPLTYVLTNIGHAQNEMRQRATLDAETTREVLHSLNEAWEGAERVRLIMRDMRTFSRADDASSTAANLDDVLDFAIKITANEVRHRARLIRHSSNVPDVLVHPTKLGQVFVNLLLNAAYAIPEGHAEANTITISARVDEGGQVLVDVIDTGMGIPSANLARIFDPFFTTKPVGVGTGLGLSICHANLRSAGGDLSVTSEVGRGTTFTVRVRPAPAAAKVSTRTAPPIPSAVRGRVLLVDDESGVANAVQRYLRKDCDVVVELAGRPALARMEAGECFDVVLCDLMMPNMTGMELYERVLARAPAYAAKFIFMTGGAFTPSTQAFLDRFTNERLGKPFDMKKLKALLAERFAAAIPLRLAG